MLTGCLRVAKESIFTGLNNFKVCSITDSDFDEAFGFIDSEVKSILQYYGQETHYTEVKNGMMDIVSEKQTCIVHGMCSIIVVIF